MNMTLTNNDNGLDLLQGLHVRREGPVPLLRPEVEPLQPFTGVWCVDVDDESHVELRGGYPSLQVTLDVPDASANVQQGRAAPA